MKFYDDLRDAEPTFNAQNAALFGVGVGNWARSHLWTANDIQQT